MQQAVGAWITGIAIVAILGALIDIILPNGSFRKFTGFIIGLVLLVMILQPLISLMGQAGGIEKLIQKNTLNYSAAAASYQADNFEELQRQQLEKTFRKNLESSLARQLSSAAELENVKVAVTFRNDGDGTDLSMIETIEVWAAGSNRTVSIQPVVIGPADKTGNSRAQPSGTERIDGDKISAVKAYLSEVCEISEDKIHVYGIDEN